MLIIKCYFYRSFAHYLLSLFIKNESLITFKGNKMSQNIDDKACPFCLKDNQCDVANSCWCKVIEIPAQLLTLVPAELANQSCICNACVISFNNDPDLFLKNREGSVIS